MKNRRLLTAALLLLPFAAVTAAALCYELILKIGENMPPCVFRSMTALYCPGCGNTRSVMALLKLDILESLRLNPSPILCLVFALLGYFELLLKSMGKGVRLFPRSGAFWTVFVLLLLTYYTVRLFVPFLRPI